MLSVVSMILGVAAYGLAGARLAVGSRAGVKAALRSLAWWSGTALQGLGFLFTLVARHDLPMLIVQACVVSALAVTATVEHVTGVKRLSRIDGAAILAMMTGIAMIGVSTQPGPAPSPTWTHALVLVLGCALGAAALPIRITGRSASLLYGSASGFGFSIAAVGARLLISDETHPILAFWRLPLASWIVGILVVAGLGVGQWTLTRGLARGTSTPTLGCMYVMATFVPALTGLLLLDEFPRPGTVPLILLGLAIGGVGGGVLLRHEAERVEDASS